MPSAPDLRPASGWTALAASLRHEPVRRLQAAWAVMIAASWAYTVAIAVLAYDAGGAATVGLAVALRSLPALVGAPVTALVADRLSRRAALVASGAVTALALAASAALAALGAPPVGVFALGALVALATMVFRQAQSALLPRLAEDDAQLTAANAATTTIEGAGMIAGPALGGTLVALSSVPAVLGLTAVAALIAAAVAAAVAAPAERPEPAAVARGPLAAARATARAMTAAPPVRLVFALLFAQTVVSGAFNVLVVVCAIELVDLGREGVGALTAAYGLGGLLGGLAVIGRTARADLTRWLWVGLVLWGVPLVALGLVPGPALALALVAAVGFGNTLFDVASVTLLQRVVPDGLLARTFGALETVVVVGLGVGALLAPVAVEELGIRAALVAAGALLPLLVLAAAGELRRLRPAFTRLPGAAVPAAA
jgi:MFS family permease